MDYQDRFVKAWFNAHDTVKSERERQQHEGYKRAQKEARERFGTSDLREARSIEQREAWKRTVRKI